MTTQPTSKTLATLAASLLAACGSLELPDVPQGQGMATVKITADAVVAGATVQAGVPSTGLTATLERDDSGLFVGELAVPPGEQTVTLRAFADTDGDGSVEPAGEETTVVRASQSEPAAVYARLGRRAERDAPHIAAVVFGRASPRAGEPVRYKVRAANPDGSDASIWWASDTCEMEFVFDDDSQRDGMVVFAHAGPCPFVVWSEKNGVTESFEASLNVLEPASP